MTIADVAKMWQSHGMSCIPITTNKKAAIRWRDYQSRLPDLGEVSEWWGNGHPYGIAIICGTVSGNLEMTEIEGRALSSATLTDIANAADSLGCGAAWDLVSNGYTQQSPSGGLHVVYRIFDHEIPGNEKIAHNADRVVLAETRGEGGYFVSAPSPGSCHPSGEGWVLASGNYGEVPSISWDERQGIHAAIRAALDTPVQAAPSSPRILATPSATVAVVAPRTPASPGTPRGATSVPPGTDWANQTDWAEILEPVGWTLLNPGSVHGNERMWVRPGKNAKDGHSASTDYQGKPGLYVWSTSAGLPTEIPLTKLFIYSHYWFNGNISACAKELKRRGYGDQDLTMGELANLPVVPQVAEDPQQRFTFDDMGNAMHLWHVVKDRFRYVHEEKEFYLYSGTAWSKEYTGALIREWAQITENMAKQAMTTDDEALKKWATRSRSQAATNSAINLLKAMQGATISASEMDTQLNLINLPTGTFNIETQQQESHNREHLMTRLMQANYNPEATCPKFEAFMEQVLPDEQVRRYVQRAVGYSLLGRADRRAFFLIYGPSGTGKSQFLSTMEYVFGDYGATAAEGTFRTKDSGGGPNNDLHGLRGKRFVSTSETAENASFNENLLKRLTGRDQVVSRDLYQSNITWTPECALWLATNHPPRFNSDDDAIWKRAKLVPFLTKFGTDVPEIPDYARTYLYAEADGILNWILAGMYDFLANGLGEPEAVATAATDHRAQSDSVVRFLEDQISEGTLVESPTGTIRTKELFAMYDAWSRTSGERGLGSRRFINRLESTGRATFTRTNQHSVWRGIYAPRVAAWIGQASFVDKDDK